MRLKTGVSIFGVRPELLLGIMIADGIYLSRMQRSVVVTSITDGNHSKNSLHYSGQAFDIRTRDDNDGVQWGHNLKDSIYADLQSSLGPDFDVVIERTHIHIEYQPKRQR